MSAAANPHRGEVALGLGRCSGILRPSFNALAAVEAEHGPVLALAQEAAEGRVRIEAMAGVFHHCLLAEAGDERPSAEEIGAAILEAGMVEALKTYRSLLERILGGICLDD